MVKYSDRELDSIFHALANTTRRQILWQVAQEPLAVTDIATPHDMSLAAVSKHIKVLVDSGLVEQEKDGRIRRCHFNAQPLQVAGDLIAHYQQFWETQFDALESYLEENQTDDDANK